MREGGWGQWKIIKCQHYRILKRKQYIILDPVQIGRFSLPGRGAGGGGTLEKFDQTQMFSINIVE
jgi:hypothetical protein